MKPQPLILSLLALSFMSWADESRARLDGVDAISQASIQSAFQVLRRDYIRPDELTFDQLNRAALQGVLERLNFGASLVRAAAEGEAKSPPKVRAESLTSRLGYLKPMTLAPAEVRDMSQALTDLKNKGVSHIILDLRSATSPTELEVAAGMAELFLPRGELLFKLRRLSGGDASLFISKTEPAWTGPVVALVDADSTNVAETLAAILKQKKRALIVGTRTRGATVRYEEMPLDAGWRLRFASAEVLLADDDSVYKRGVEPDFSVPQTSEQKQAALLHMESLPVKAVVFEEARLRFNEKALVSGKNPDLDDYVARSTGREMTYDHPPARDAVIQRAADLMGNVELMK
jgi:hypothetical protein